VVPVAAASQANPRTALAAPSFKVTTPESGVRPALGYGSAGGSSTATTAIPTVTSATGVAVAVTKIGTDLPPLAHLTSPATLTVSYLEATVTLMAGTPR